MNFKEYLTEAKKTKYKGWTYEIVKINDNKYRYDIYDKDGDVFDIYIDDGTESTFTKAESIAQSFIGSFALASAVKSSD